MHNTRFFAQSFLKISVYLYEYLHDSQKFHGIKNATLIIRYILRNLIQLKLKIYFLNSIYNDV